MGVFHLLGSSSFLSGMQKTLCTKVTAETGCGRTPFPGLYAGLDWPFLGGSQVSKARPGAPFAFPGLNRWAPRGWDSACDFSVGSLAVPFVYF
jgi:hypothetical protein